MRLVNANVKRVSYLNDSEHQLEQSGLSSEVASPSLRSRKDHAKHMGPLHIGFELRLFGDSASLGGLTQMYAPFEWSPSLKIVAPEGAHVFRSTDRFVES
jgi:hypothetical protein